MTRPADLRGLIRDIPDFPKPGIVFKDITPVFADPDGLRAAVDCVVGHATDVDATHIVSAEARGFVLGGAGAAAAGLGFVLGRKPGKLPSRTLKASYDLEYGTDCLEIHDDAVRKGQRVLIVDDLLATGGTARATCNLVKQLGGEVHALAFLIELASLNGRSRLSGERVHTVLTY